MTARERALLADQLPLFPEHLVAMRRARRPAALEGILWRDAYVAPVRSDSGRLLAWCGIREDARGQWLARFAIPGGEAWSIVTLHAATGREAADAAALAIRELRGGVLDGSHS